MRKILIENTEVKLDGCSYGFPWEHDATCYNFRRPEEIILAQHIHDIENDEDVETLVIGCRLDDYGFIAGMKNLRQLYIYDGSNIYNLAFVEKLVALQQLYIAKAHIDFLEPLVELLKKKKEMFDAEGDYMKKLDYVMEGIYIESDRGDLDKEILTAPRLYIGEMIIK